MTDGIDLAAAAAQGVEVEEPEGPQEAPSVMSATTRYLVGRADVTPPAEDGSRIIRLVSGNGATIIEANLAAPLCEFLGTKLTTIEVIPQDDDANEEEAPDAGNGED